ncbi:hypothetical protein [Dactylosporangium roseum]|nr:hypothetical protein [Dactylosporangium roseum]
MGFPLTFAAVLLLLAAFIGALKYVAAPIHHQGREAEFDEFGRPY